MLCQECNERPATLHFMKKVNGQKMEIHLCEVCAKEKNVMKDMQQFGTAAGGFTVHNLLAELLNMDSGAYASGAGQVRESQMAQPLKCENCGLTYQQFGKIGKFGCSECYRYFGAQLNPLLKRIHGNTVHAGKVPKRTGGELKLRRELEMLKEELGGLVEREEFEKAVAVRDRIRELEQPSVDREQSNETGGQAHLDSNRNTADGQEESGKFESKRNADEG
jgi:protein arginine kinase activator